MRRFLSSTARWLAWSLSFFLCLASANAKELRIEKFDAQIAVLPNSSVNVTESITVHFIGGPWHGLYREIPVEYVTPQGMNYSLFLNLTSITDGAHNPLKYDSSRERHYRKLKIYVDHADESVQTIIIQYTVSDALRFFEDHDEFYWNITGDEWTVPINSASAAISLPVEAKNIRANVYTGAYRSIARDAVAEVTGNGVEVRTTAPLAFHQGVTVAIAFDKGAVQPPTAADKVGLFLRSNWPLFFPLIVAAMMFWLWWNKGRDPRLRPIAAQYEPPDKLTPSEVGTLVDNSADMRDITSARTNRHCWMEFSAKALPVKPFLWPACTTSSTRACPPSRIAFSIPSFRAAITRTVRIASAAPISAPDW